MIESSAALNEEAAAWVVRLHSDQRTRDDLEAFRAWLSQSEDHERAYADHALLWSAFDHVAQTNERDVLTRALRSRRRGLGRRRMLLAGFGAAAAAALAITAVGPGIGVKTYRTEAGERRHITLSDGSTVLLNTASTLRVSYQSSERRLVLEDGEAFFRVAHDADRPFRVFAAGDEVRALGTAFDVRKTGDQARVTLEEGRVAIYRGDDSVPAVLKLVGGGGRSDGVRPLAVLTPGQQASLGAGESRVRAIDIKKTQAWRVGRLILDDTSMAEAAAELNRYGYPKIVLADSKARALRISGVFHTEDSGAFVEAVTTAFPLQVVSRNADEIVLQSRIM